LFADPGHQRGTNFSIIILDGFAIAEKWLRGDKDEKILGQVREYGICS